MRKTRVLVLLIVLGMVLSACGPSTEIAEQVVSPSPASTAAPPATSAPTHTPLPPTVTTEPTPAHTSVPPTATAFPEPSATPTEEPEPTATLPSPTSQPLGADDLKITIVYDNTSYDPRLTPDWGFAALIEYRGHTILFDTGGNTRILLDNMELLEIDPAEIEAVALSHIHGDHTDGLPGLFGLDIPLTIYIPPSFPNNWKSWARLHADLVPVAPGQEISDGIFTTGEMAAGRLVEQALVVETGDGIVVITGCAHPGVVEIVARASELFGGSVKLVVGGFHLMDKDRDELRDIITELRALDVELVSPTHCTGKDAIAVFAALFGEDYVEGGAGRVIVVESGPTVGGTASETQGFLLEGVGFSTPESVLYDPQADLYLVSNINGSPSAVDGNGFISQVSPEGKVIDLKWIEGGSEGVVLSAPKGMALAGDVLYVADIDTVRSFDRSTGAALGEIKIEGASFLNDVTTAEDGTVYVSDSAVNAIFQVAPDGSVTQLAKGAQLGTPNGVQATGDTILIADSSRGRIYELGADGLPTAEQTVPSAGLDGLVLLDDGSLLVSSWDASAIYLVSPTGQVSQVFAGITAPADIGFDTKRGYVLIPHFRHDRVEARPLP